VLKKWKAMLASEVETAPGKGKAVKKRRPAAQAEENTSATKKVLAKPLKTSKKFSLKETQSRSSGLMSPSLEATRFVTHLHVYVLSLHHLQSLRGPRLLRVVMSPPLAMDLTSLGAANAPVVEGMASAGFVLPLSPNVCNVRFCNADETSGPVTSPFTDRP
jgi:hypothetical protein